MPSEIATSSDDVEPQQKGKGQLKREATEAELINALGRVVRRSGLRQVGVNEVIKEAGIGKASLYRYFGGLPGLVRAWGEKNKVWPDLSRFYEAPPARPEDTPELVKQMLRNQAQALRDDPMRAEITAEQFMSSSPISGALQDIRHKLGEEHVKIFASQPAIRENVEMMRILMAAASYLGLRAAKSPAYMSTDLDDEEKWQALMQKMDEIVDAVMVV